MKKTVTDLIVVGAEQPTDHHVILRLTTKEALPTMFPGQFVEVRVDDSPQTFLRRPISIHFFDETKNELWLLVAAVGEGTRRLMTLRKGDTLNCILPLGRGFSMPREAHSRVLLVGGGVGIAPLLYFGKQLKALSHSPTFLLGARRAADLLQIEAFERYGEVCLTTEDGSRGERGFVTDHPIVNDHFDAIACCGPLPMMQAVGRMAARRGIFCEVSLENMMACGLGACLCCVEKTVRGNVCVCTEGPVFNVNDLQWDKS